MSRLFGTLKQVGIVVKDINKALEHWIKVCGVGPWFYTDRLELSEFSYRGKRHDGIHLSIALANSGDIQIELIEQRCDTPSMYKAFIQAGHEGMQHWSSWPSDYEERLKFALEHGYLIGQQGNSARGRFVYLLNEGHPGSVIEMADLTEARARVFAGIRAAALDWDGCDPIRSVWPS